MAFFTRIFFIGALSVPTKCRVGGSNGSQISVFPLYLNFAEISGVTCESCDTTNQG